MLQGKMVHQSLYLVTWNLQLIHFLLFHVTPSFTFEPMYNLPYFKEADKETVIKFMREHPFAFLIGCNEENKPVATQVPVFIDEKEEGLFLTGHFMRNTDHHKAFSHNPNVLTVFSGPHTYVSASWYQNQQSASTWNYMSVHARGMLRFLDETALLEVLKRTTSHFENDPDSPSLVEKMPADYVNKMIKSIIAFEVEVTSMDNVFKLSQNRDKESYHNIIQKLEDQGGDAKFIASEMNKRKSQLFNDRP